VGWTEKKSLTYLATNLEKFLFPLLLGDPVFSDNSHIFPVMAGIDSIRPSFDKEVELTPCFPAHEFRCS
jgi:hypothetical protein